MIILNPEQRWECPNCPQTAVTHEAKPHTRYHQCHGLHGLTAPLVPAGTRCEVRVRVREDYVRKETVTTVGGAPILGVETIRDDGTDMTAYAPCVSTEGGAFQ